MTIMDYDQLRFQVNLNTGFFECSAIAEDDQMKVCSGNHDGAGMSAGNLQYNFGSANRLTELFKYMLDNYDVSICQPAFGTYTTEYNKWKTAIYSTVQQDRINFGADITDPTNDHAIIDPYKSSFGTILLTAECKSKYYSMRDNYYWGAPYDIFRQMSCVSRAALASFFDVYINRGRYYPILTIQKEFEDIDSDGTMTADQKEAEKIRKINYRGNDTTNAMDASASAFVPRRTAMAEQGGDYYGLTYDPENQFLITQDTAITEKAPSTSVFLGSAAIDTLYVGNTPVDSLYLGSTRIGGSAVAYTTSTVPNFQFRSNTNSYAGVESGGSLSITAGQKIFIDIQEPLVASRCYYTIDGSTPTSANTRYVDGIVLNASCTLKVLVESIFGVAAAVGTCTVTVAVAPTTTISPSATVQNSIPITITLTTSETGAAIKYMIGTDATVRDYTAPFTVNQNTTGVLSTSIKITYWSVGATATEAQKTITYDTSGAHPSQTVLTATAGAGTVDLSWTSTTNTTAFTIYRSTVAGTLGTWIGSTQYYAPTVYSYTDTGLTAGTTYYYTIRAGNYGTPTDSVQKSATPTAAVTGYRYIRIDGYGEYYSAAGYTNTRMIEVEIFSGGVNVLRSPTVLTASTDDTVDTGAEIGSTTPTKINNGDKSITSNSYNIWWSDITLNNNGGNAWVKFDLGSAKTIDSIRYWGYTSRAPRFKIWGTNNLADFGANGAHGAATLLWDMSLNNGTTLAGATAGTNNYVEKIGGF